MTDGHTSWQIGPEVLVQTPNDSLLHPAIETVFSLSKVTGEVARPRYVLYLDADRTKDGLIRVLADDFPVFHVADERELPPLIEKTLAHYCARMCEQYAILHAALLERNGDAILLPGEPGAGKSTLCAHLTQQGYRYYGDDFIFLRFSDLQIHAFPKAITLKRGAFDLVPEEPEYLDRSRGAIRYFTPTTGGNFTADFSALRCIILPHYVSSGVNQTQKVQPEVAALAMIQQCFGGLDRDPRMFDTIEKLVSRSAYMIDYTSSRNGQEAIEQLIKESN